MKRLFFVSIIIILSTIYAVAQVPQGINYQTVVRDNTGLAIANQNVSFRLSVVSGSATGNVVYSEIHSLSTNAFGLVNLIIGRGTPLTGLFSNIAWGSAAHFLSVELDPQGGTFFKAMGTSELMSVPYSLSSGSSTNSMSELTDVNANGVLNGQVLKWNGSQWKPSNDSIGSNISNVVRIDNANFQTVSVVDNDIVNLRGAITLTANYTKLNRDGLSISGGKFQGSGTEELLIGDETVIKGVAFSNMIIDAGSTTVFIGCTFNNMTQIGFDCTFISCNFSDCTFNTVQNLGFLTNCEINLSTMPRITSANNCNFKNSNVTASTFIGNEMNDCIIYPQSIFVGNNLDDSKVIIGGNSVTQISASGNVFDGLYNGATELIQVDCNTGFTMNVSISGNAFRGSSSTINYISIVGTYTNSSSYGMIKISDNTFVRATQVITNSSSGIKILVTDNAVKSSTLGVSNGGNLIVRNNDSF